MNIQCSRLLFMLVYGHHFNSIEYNLSHQRRRSPNTQPIRSDNKKNLLPDGGLSICVALRFVPKCVVTKPELGPNFARSFHPIPARLWLPFSLASLLFEMICIIKHLRFVCCRTHEHIVARDHSNERPPKMLTTRIQGSNCAKHL